MSPSAGPEIRLARAADAAAIAEIHVLSWQATYAGQLPDDWLAALGRPSRDDDASAGTGELRAIYLHPGYWNRGLGRLLHDHALAALSNDGHRCATLGPAYQQSSAPLLSQVGMVTDGTTKIDTIDSLVLEEVRYHRTLDAPALRVSPGGLRR